MKKTKYILALAFMVGLGYSGQTQQLSQYSQYMNNPFIVNPASAGMDRVFDINLSMRRQWAGLNNAPETYYLSADAPLSHFSGGDVFSPSLRTANRSMKVEGPNGQPFHAVGAILGVDKYGAFKKTTGNLTYAYHLPITNDINVSVGTGLGYSQLYLDQSMIEFEDANDNTYATYISQSDRTSFFDMNLGIQIYAKEFFFGYATNQVLGDKVNIGETLLRETAVLHHYLMGGYNFEVNQDVMIKPSLMVKYVQPAPVSFDINAIVEYKGQFWGGFSYRHTDAIVAMLGLTYDNMFKIGYSYDITTSDLATVSSGSHEVVLGVMFGK